MEKNIFIVSAFTKEGKGGNLAGVVLNSTDLDESNMLFIAKSLGFSETAFLIPSKKADYQVRYFTPESEVDICGHATIATFSSLVQQNILLPSTYTIETKAGHFRVQIDNNGGVYLQQSLPKYYEVIPPKEIVKSLRIKEEFLIQDLPIQIVSTGLRDILIPINSLKNLHKIQPDFQKVKEISQKYNTIGYHLFTLDTIYEESSAHCRNFAPLYGILEESATGTSNAALAAYLYKYKNIVPFQYLTFEQGYMMDEPSEINVKMKINNSKITDIMVGGFANILEEKRIVHK